MTEAIYLEVTEKAEAAHKAKRRVSVSGMLKILGVSRSGYRAWLKHVPSNAEKRRESVKAKIKDIYDKSKQNYGAPKITQVLRKTGETISERTVGQYMKQMGIKAQWVKPWTITARDSDFSSMDLYSRKIIAWTLSNTLEVSCVIETINKAKAKRKIEEPLIMHSDRSVQYVSKEYKRVTANMQCSYSKKAYPWDNACIESFHSLIKREWLNRFKIRDYNHAYRLVFEYLKAFYNTKRIHSHCDYMSPNDYEELYRRLQQDEEPIAS